MPINIFEPSLQVRHPLLDYEKLQIQGTFPRPHEIPTDVFPTYSVIAGVHVDRPVGKVATFTEDNRMRVDGGPGVGGLGSALSRPNAQVWFDEYGHLANEEFPADNSIDIVYELSYVWWLNSPAASDGKILLAIGIDTQAGPTYLVHDILPKPFLVDGSYSHDSRTLIYPGGIDMRKGLTSTVPSVIQYGFNADDVGLSVNIVYWSSMV